MQYLTGVRISGLPALFNRIVTNFTPIQENVCHEAAVSLEIVVKARPLQQLPLLWSIVMFNDLWTWRGECSICAIARATGIREQTVAPRLRCCLEEKSFALF